MSKYDPAGDCICLNCGKFFHVKPTQIRRGGGKYCSKECYTAAGRVTLVCLNCGESFVRKKYYSYYKCCSKKCSNKALPRVPKNPRVQCVCQQCGEDFEVKRDVAAKGQGKFCSASCRSIHAVQNTKKKRTLPEIRFKELLDNTGFADEYAEQKHLKGIGIADFFFPEMNMAIEVDGVWWHSKPEVKKNDERKNKAYAEAGILLIRFTDEEIKNMWLESRTN